MFISATSHQPTKKERHVDHGWNWQIAQAINGLSGHVAAVDALMRVAASDLIFLLILGAALWWLLTPADDIGKTAALAAGVAVFAGQVVNLAIGHFIDIPRPFIAHPQQVRLLVQAAHDSSFPSDHATAAFSVAATALLRTLPGRWLFLAAALLIALARVYVGAHYPLDVIVGAALGTFWAITLLILEPRLQVPYHRVIAVARRLRLA